MRVRVNPWPSALSARQAVIFVFAANMCLGAFWLFGLLYVGRGTEQRWWSWILTAPRSLCSPYEIK